MPRLLAWLLFALWLLAAAALGWHARRAAWGPAEALLAAAGWLLLPLVTVPWEVRKLFGPVFTYEVIRLGRRPLTFALRGLYVVLLMGLLVWVYLLWLESINGYQRRDRGWSAVTIAIVAGTLLAALAAGALLRGWTRWVSLLVFGGLAAIAALADTDGGKPVPPAKLASFATWFFSVFVFIQFGVVALLTPAYVAGSVADEKERKTLEFLLATDLAPREILFGKLAARVVTLLMFVLAGLPVVAFLQLFGGIDPELLITATVAAAITVLGFAAVGVFFSTTLRRPRDAIALTYLLLVAYLIGSMIAAVWLMELMFRWSRPGSGGWTESIFGFTFDMVPVLEALFGAANVVAQGNPVWQVVLLIEPVSGRGGLTPTNMVAALGRYALYWAVVGGLLMAYSVWRLRPIALGHNKAPTQKAIDRQARRRPAIGTDPVLWKEVFLETGFKGGCVGYAVGLVVLGLVFVWPPMIAYSTFFEPNRWGVRSLSRDQWDDFAQAINIWCRFTTAGLGTLLLLAAAVRGAGVVSGERDRDTWVSLMATPLGAWEMLRGKWLGCVLGVRRGFAALLAVWCVGLACRAVEPVMVVPAVLVLGVYTGAFAWVGILCSLTARTTLIATIRAVAASVFLAGGFWIAIGLCCLAPLALVVGGSASRDFEGLTDLLMGVTPAVVLFWLPVRRFDTRDLEPFAGDNSIGALAPLIGLVVWVGLGLLVGKACYAGFQRVTNRGRDDVPTGQRPAGERPGERGA